MYNEAVLDFRRRKDEHFAAGRGPIPPESLDAFGGLSYFAPDRQWLYNLPVQRPKNEDPAESEVPLQTSTGQTRYMADFGSVAVPFETGVRHLTLYTPLGEEQPARAFIPFRDGTSGVETYGAGRYLDAQLAYTPEGTFVQLDFNLAYHPYCAYADGWTCPLPPQHNWFPERITAGERLPEISAD